VKATTTASNQIKAILVGAEQELRDAMEVQSLLELATRASNLAPLEGQHLALASLGRRWLQLYAEILELDVMIRTILRRTAPALLARPGIGIHSATQLLLAAGGNPDRLRNDAAVAALCGVSPVQASSGQTHRHRLSRGGDRAANNALWTIANNRMIHDTRTREFAADTRPPATAATTPCVSSSGYIARETFSLIRDALSQDNALSTAA